MAAALHAPTPAPAWWTPLPASAHSEAEYEASVLTLWNELDTLVARHNYGCVHKSPLSHPNTSKCSGRAARFNPYAFGYMRPVQMLAHARHIRRVAATAAQSRAVTYCEIGMNGGHGVAAALLAEPTLVAHSFDLHEWRYSLAVADFLVRSRHPPPAGCPRSSPTSGPSA